MGDMADDSIEQGMDEWHRHRAGLCGEYGACPYCEIEDIEMDYGDND
jgi:hypothetical protein